MSTAGASDLKLRDKPPLVGASGVREPSTAGWRRPSGAWLQYPNETDEAFVVVATTRIKLRHWWYLVCALSMMHRLYIRAGHFPGFLRGQVSVADPWTIINVSVWLSLRAMFDWSGTEDHVKAVRWTYSHASETWSAQSRLLHVSPSGHRWGGDVRLA